MGQHCSQRVDMEGEGLILETRVNKTGVNTRDKESKLKTKGQHWRQELNIGNKESTLETRGQKG